MPKREFALDLLRVMACFLVVWQHVTECYYINPDLSVPTHDEMPLIGWMNSMTPIDFLPDFIPPGLIDDLSIVAWALKEASDELEKYKQKTKDLPTGET